MIQNVLLIPSSYPHELHPISGVFFRDHANALKAVGIEVTVLAIIPVSLKHVFQSLRKGIHPNFRRDSYIENGIETWHYEFLSFPYLRKINSLRRKKIALTLSKQIYRSKPLPDIAHLHGYLAGEAAIGLNKKLGVPFVYTAHYSAIELGKLNQYETKLLNRLIHASCARSAVSGKFATHLEAISAKRFRVIPNPIETKEGMAFKKYFMSLEQRSASDNPSFSICTVAALNSNKNIDMLIKSFKQFIRFHPDAILNIAGDGPEKKTLENLAINIGISEHINFLGFLSKPEVFRLMHQSLFYVLSSKYETFGVVVIEALSTGTPVLATRCGGPESIIVDGSLGMLVDINPSALTAGLLEMVTAIQNDTYDPVKIAERISNEYSPRSIGNQMKDLYSSILTKE
jgi:glycosyltransferase involved in cell wall biosynthesis